jgi:hypothetical protein
MISAVFIICFNNSNVCFSTGPETIFKTVEECKSFATQQELLWTNNTNIPPHTAIHQCVEWGTKAHFTEV